MEDTERCRSDQACERIRQEYASFKKEGKLLSKIKFVKGKCSVCTVVTTKGNILAKAVNSLSHFLV